MNKNKADTDNISERFFWIIGIGVIIFLILLFGSLTAHKITNNGISKFLSTSNVVENNVNSQETYLVLSDGTKQNVSKEVADAKFIFSDVEIINCLIEERKDLTEFAFNIRNITGEAIQNKKVLVKLYNSEDKLISKFTVNTGDLEAFESTVIKTILQEKCVEANSLEIEPVN